MADWFYTRNGQQQGPVPAEVLAQLLALGELPPDSLVWRDGMANWQPVISVAELNPPPGGQPTFPSDNPGGRVPAIQVGPSPMLLGYASGATGPPNFQSQAIIAFIVACLSIVCFGIVVGPIGVILGIHTLLFMKQCGNTKGRGFAIAAVIIGSLFFVLNAVFLVWVFAIR